MQRKNDLNRLKQLETKFGTITLLYAAKDEEHNNAVVLKELFTYDDIIKPQEIMDSHSHLISCIFLFLSCLKAW